MRQPAGGCCSACVGLVVGANLLASRSLLVTFSFFDQWPEDFPGRDHSSIRAWKPMKTASRGSGARPEPADGPITLTATNNGACGFSGTSRFTTSAPELGVIDVFSEHAIESQHQLARHRSDGHGGVLFSFYQPKIEVAQVAIGFAVDGAMRCFHQQMAEQPVALLGDVPHANGFAAGSLAGVQTTVGRDAPRAVESRDRLECVNHHQRGE